MRGKRQTIPSELKAHNPEYERKAKPKHLASLAAKVAVVLSGVKFRSLWRLHLEGNTNTNLLETMKAATIC